MKTGKSGIKGVAFVLENDGDDKGDNRSLNSARSAVSNAQSFRIMEAFDDVVESKEQLNKY